METMLLLFLLMMNGDERTGESLKSFLKFYRENRDLISALSASPKEEPSPPEQTENRPREEVGDLSVIEEYLKKFSV